MERKMHDIDIELQLMLQGKFREGRAISDKLQNLGPEGIPDVDGNTGNPDVWIRHTFNRGWFYLQDGDYQAGCQALEAGRFIKVYGSDPLKTNAPIYNPKEHDIKGKSIIISLEGGYGDEIISARFVKSFKDIGASKVYLAASPEIVDVFKRIDGCDGVILRNESHLVSHDYWVPGFSAGWVAGHTFKDFPGKPYLNALPEKVEQWKEKVSSDKIKVGIRWAGNPKFEHQQFRRFPPSYLTEEISKYKEFQVYSLQRDQNLVPLPDNVIDLQDDMTSWDDTIGIIMNLDLVITSCTSIAHLAAALGKETWVITPILPYHTWTFGAPHSKKSPYYECVTIYRQEEAKTWDKTFQKMYKDLEKKFKLDKIEHPVHDKEGIKVNLGSGFMKIDGYLNVDNSDICRPDVKADLNVLPWPFETDSVTHIVAKDILEHLGNHEVSFLDIIKEMYRISENGAIWEVQVPHHRSDHAFDDPTHINVITPSTFKLFDRQNLIDGFKIGRSDSPLAFEIDVDMEICETNFHFVGDWINMLKEKKITEEQLRFALQTQNNVAESTVMLIQIHKPGRFTVKELHDVIDERMAEKSNDLKLKSLK
jgi:hypothetical protein